MYQMHCFHLNDIIRNGGTLILGRVSQPRSLSTQGVCTVCNTHPAEVLNIDWLEDDTDRCKSLRIIITSERKSINDKIILHA